MADRLPGPLLLLLTPPALGTSAVLLLIVEIRRALFLTTSQHRDPDLVPLCVNLTIVAICVMCVDPLASDHSNITVIIGIVPMLPWLIAMSKLARSGAWFGLAGAVVFVAAMLVLLVWNCYSKGSVYGFTHSRLVAY